MATIKKSPATRDYKLLGFFIVGFIVLIVILIGIIVGYTNGQVEAPKNTGEEGPFYNSFYTTGMKVTSGRLLLYGGLSVFGMLLTLSAIGLTW